MATKLVSYNCGCGFKAQSVEEAVKHSDQLGHTLTAHGDIRAA